MRTSVVTFEKPCPHVPFYDWVDGLERLKADAANKQRFAFSLRHGARQLRNETATRTEWDTYFNDIRLADRIHEVLQARTSSEELLERVQREMDALKEDKAATERELEGLATFLLVTSDCLSGRDGRKATELTEDSANIELKKELCVEEMNKKMLAEYVELAWEKVNILEKLKFDLLLDISNKTETIYIDNDQLTLNNACANITFKTDPTRDPTKSMSYEEWQADQKRFLAEGARSLGLACGVREQLFLARERARNAMRDQVDGTDFALRRRIYETRRAHTELKWQKTKMEDNMRMLIKEMSTLKAALLGKSNALKLAETRLENRALRPAVELARDPAHRGLQTEVQRLRDTIAILKDRLDSAKTTYNDLETECLRIGVDLDDKSNTLDIDVRALEMRDAAKGDPSNLQADRSIELITFRSRLPKP